MITDTDERRAKAMAFEHWGLLYSSPNGTGVEFLWSTKLTPAERDNWLRHARAIRASDEAAGMVLVPREATVEMIVAGTETWLCKAAMEDRAEVCWRAMIAATEADNG